MLTNLELLEQLSCTDLLLGTPLPVPRLQPRSEQQWRQPRREIHRTITHSLHRPWREDPRPGVSRRSRRRELDATALTAQRSCQGLERQFHGRSSGHYSKDPGVHGFLRMGPQLSFHVGATAAEPDSAHRYGYILRSCKLQPRRRCCALRWIVARNHSQHADRVVFVRDLLRLLELHLRGFADVLVEQTW